MVSTFMNVLYKIIQLMKKNEVITYKREVGNSYS